MTEVIARLFVAGRPRTKGHLKTHHQRGSGGRACRFWETERDELKAWMRVLGRSIQSQLGITLGRVDGAVRRVDGGEPYAGPVEVQAFFRFERQIGVNGEVIPSHQTPWPTAIDLGDEDTLRRAINDALVKNGVIADDSLVVGTGNNWKRWCEPGEQAGVLIVVRKAPSLLTVLLAEDRA